MAVQLLLPQELIEEEILSRLPVNSVLRFRCVSKSWRSLIATKRFIRAHLQNSTNDRNMGNWRVIFNNGGDDDSVYGFEQCCMRSYLEDDETRLRRSPMDEPSIFSHCIMMFGSVVGSCNGLLCVMQDPNRIFLWNPATRMSMQVPKVGHKMLLPIICKIGFGWDEESDAYKVFVSLRDKVGPTRMGRLYSSKTNSWKTVERGWQYAFAGNGKLACGKLYWLPKRSRTDAPVIEYLDLKTEEFGVIEAPIRRLPRKMSMQSLRVMIECSESEPESYLGMKEYLHIEGFQGMSEYFVWLGERVGCVCVVCHDEFGDPTGWLFNKTWVEMLKEPWMELISKPGKIITCSCRHGLGFFCIQSLVSPHF